MASRSLILCVSLLSIGTLVALPVQVYSQEYPNKPIRIVTADSGGNADFVSRMLGQGISGPLGQQVIVENRGGILAMEIVAKAPPDGYTLLVQGGPVWLTPLLQKVTYDPVNDFSPITWAGRQISVLVVHPSLPVLAVPDLIALAKAHPGALNYGSQQNGSTQHLAAELFKSMAGVQMVRISYKGAGQMISDQMAGHVQLTFASPPSVMQHIKSNRLKVLAVTSAQPSTLVPGVPTISGSGLPGYEAVSLNGAFVPVKTPAAIINRLNHEMVRFLRTDEAKVKCLNSGVEAVGSSPEEFASAIRSEIAKWSKVIRDAGIKGE